MKIKAIIDLTRRARARLRDENDDKLPGQRWTCAACRRAFDGDETGLYTHARCCGLLREALGGERIGGGVR